MVQFDDRVLVFNPVSGSAGHAEQVHDLADEYGVTVRETEESGDAIDFAREAAAGRHEVGGGDGTIHEVVRGLFEADALDSTVFGVIPTGRVRYSVESAHHRTPVEAALSAPGETRA